MSPHIAYDSLCGTGGDRGVSSQDEHDRRFVSISTVCPCHKRMGHTFLPRPSAFPSNLADSASPHPWFDSGLLGIAGGRVSYAMTKDPTGG